MGYISDLYNVLLNMDVVSNFCRGAENLSRALDSVARMYAWIGEYSNAIKQ